MLGGNKSPEAFALGLLEARGGQLEPGLQCSFMADTLMDVFTDSLQANAGKPTVSQSCSAASGLNVRSSPVGLTPGGV